MTHYMTELKVKNQPVLLIGGGHVATRKLTGLLECRARVTVVAPHLDSQISNWVREKKVFYHKEPFREEHLDIPPKPLLVFAATAHPPLNRGIAKLCTARGLLCNAADDASVSGFLVPATIRQNSVSVAVGTAGKSPALSRLLKEQIEAWLDPGWGEIVELFGNKRDGIVRIVTDTVKRHQFWREAAQAAAHEKRFRQRENHLWFEDRLRQFLNSSR